jgi:hypothetical protein
MYFPRSDDEERSNVLIRVHDSKIFSVKKSEVVDTFTPSRGFVFPTRLKLTGSSILKIKKLSGI